MTPLGLSPVTSDPIDVDTLGFPPGFLWGLATSAYQTEGGNDMTDWWEWERAQGLEACGEACDHFRRFEDDIALFADLGFNAYRFSIEWARIEPAQGEFSWAALDHYRRVLETCHERGLSPVVTFHHFTLPRWAARSGGWENEAAPRWFARYCERTAAHLGHLVGTACTINEPNMPPLLGYLLAWHPPGKRDAVAREQVTYALIRAHELGRDALKNARDDLRVGLTLALADWEVLPGGEEELEDLRKIREDVFLEVAAADDFLGVQTYTRHRVGHEGFMPVEEGVELTSAGWEFWPEALEVTVRRAWHATRGTPLIVTENGVATDDDSRRVVFVDRALRGLHACIADGIDVGGYFYWTALDNFEWNHGYAQRFGMIGVDRATQERTIKPSARRLGSIARNNKLVGGRPR